MMRLTAQLLLVTILAVCPAAPGLDKDETTLTIAVVDAVKDRPVPKASVTVHFVSGRKLFIKKVRSEWSTKTNAKGLAELPEMPSGKVRVQVIAAGYQTFGDEFDVSGLEQTITVKLQRPKGSQVSAHELPEPAPQAVPAEKGQKKKQPQ